MFGPLKNHYNANCSEYIAAHPDHKIDKQSWPALFKSSLEAGISPANLINGFQACVIYPFNPDIIAEHGYAPSLALVVPPAPDIPQNTVSDKYVTYVSVGPQVPDVAITDIVDVPVISDVLTTDIVCVDLPPTEQCVSPTLSST